MRQDLLDGVSTLQRSGLHSPHASGIPDILHQRGVSPARQSSPDDRRSRCPRFALRLAAERQGAYSDLDSTSQLFG